MVPPHHEPVLVEEVVRWLLPAAPGLIVDATVGLGGHAAALLEACPDCRLLGLDRDSDALAAAAARLAPVADRVVLRHSPFAALPGILADDDGGPPAAVLADLGCSSLQLDTAARGFSFQHDGPLDMRMGAEGPTAADLVNSAAPEDLMRILREYGEERRARSIVAAIVRRREEAPILRTGQLAELVAGVLGRRPNDRIHPATRTFQALRIEVNDELGQLERFLEPTVRALAPGGRIGIISFHSLEDRIVKHTLRRLEGRISVPRDRPEPPDRPPALVRVLTGKPVRPAPDEEDRNPRARSARLRVAERLPDEEPR
jgi:16S rRNA (cytosine1402-N4)-methyltransferase